MIPQVNACDVAQAVELVRALRDQLHEMTHRLVLLECQDLTGTNGRASAIRCEAAALRLDIAEAEFHIDRLRLRYLDYDESALARRPVRQPSSRKAQTGTGNRHAQVRV